jgi:hypothetical protein
VPYAEVYTSNGDTGSLVDFNNPFVTAISSASTNLTWSVRAANYTTEGDVVGVTIMITN